MILPLYANVGSGINFKAMNGDNPRAERAVCNDASELPRTLGVEVGEAKGLKRWKQTRTSRKCRRTKSFM
jgi:hypothetical protein